MSDAGTTGTGERRIAAAPVAVRVILAAALAVQIGWHARQPDPRAEAQALRPAPPAAVLRLAALGDETVLAKLLLLRLQAHDSQPGVSIPFMDLDYDRLAGWLDAIVDLDPRAGYPLLAAARLYGSVPDPARQRVMFDLVHRRFLEDPGRRWPWLAHVALLARHRLGDPALALRYTRALAEHAAGPAAGMAPGRHAASPMSTPRRAPPRYPRRHRSASTGAGDRTGPGRPAIRATNRRRLRPCHASSTASPSSRSRSC